MFESTVVCGRIALGIQGEHHARKVSFAETQLWKERFGEGRFELLHKRNGDDVPYPITLTIDDDVPYWYVTASDTAVAGVGKCELRYIVNDVVIKSCTFITDVDASLGEGTEAPEPYKAWVDEVLEAAEDVKDATVHQPIIGENGNWWVWDFNASAYVDTGVSVSGGGATSWNDLKDKPFYEKNEIAELVSNLTSEDYNNRNYPPCNFVVGNTYDVIWNGESYNGLICYDSHGYHTIGGEGYPFIIDDDGGDSLYVLDNENEEGNFTVSIIRQKTIKKLDEKYLPDSVVLETELENKGYQTEEQVTELINNALGGIENGTY